MHTCFTLSSPGPKGKLERTLPTQVSFLEENSILLVTYDPSVRNAKAFFGLYRALVANMITGTSEGFEKNMEMIGVGYRSCIAPPTHSLVFAHLSNFVYCGPFLSASSF